MEDIEFQTTFEQERGLLTNIGTGTSIRSRFKTPREKFENGVSEILSFFPNIGISIRDVRNFLLIPGVNGDNLNPYAFALAFIHIKTGKALNGILSIGNRKFKEIISEKNVSKCAVVRYIIFIQKFIKK